MFVFRVEIPSTNLRRARASFVGGTFSAGSRTDGGFQVHAVLPTPEVAP